MSSIDLERLFVTEEGPDGRRLRRIESAIYDSVTAGAGETVNIDFGGVVNPSAARLWKKEESDAGRVLIGSTPGWLWLCEMAGFDTPKAWCILELPRHRLRGLPSEPTVPGDFDLVMGTSDKDGIVSFDALVCFEFKLRKVPVGGEPGRFATGLGTGQARGATELGFDRVVLAHILIGEGRQLPEGYARSWGGLVNTELDRAIYASAGKVRDTEVKFNGTGPYGYAIFVIGQIPGVDVTRTGAMSFVNARPAPDRPLRYRSDVEANRLKLRAGMQALLGTRRPFKKVLAP